MVTMGNRMKKTIAVLLVCSFLLCVPANAALAKSTGKQTSEKAALLNRIDFGNSYIMGQSIKSGAVYLLQRKKSEINSMLKYRTDYRQEILEDFQLIESKSDQKTGSKKP
jgi:hypothetical protein